MESVSPSMVSRAIFVHFPMTQSRNESPMVSTPSCKEYICYSRIRRSAPSAAAMPDERMSSHHPTNTASEYLRSLGRNEVSPVELERFIAELGAQDLGSR